MHVYHTDLPEQVHIQDKKGIVTLMYAICSSLLFSFCLTLCLIYSGDVFKDCGLGPQRGDSVGC